MAQRQGWPVPVDVRQHGFRMKAGPPQIIQTHQLKPGGSVALVAQSPNAQLCQTTDELVRHPRMRPARAIIVIAQNSETARRPWYQVSEDFSYGIDLFGSITRHEVACN